MTEKDFKKESLSADRVVSGMRSTGSLHLGNYHGALKNWLKLQHDHECFFFAADWHAMTTHYEEFNMVSANSIKIVTDWLSAGLDPKACTIFVQSHVPEHAELHLLLSMITPVTWLERVPTYKDQQQQLKEKDLANIGFLSYPLLQSADILLYKAGLVPVGEDQVSHVELVREVARRFNHVFGRDEEFLQLVETAINKLGKKQAKLFRNYMQEYQQQGNAAALEQGAELINSHAGLSVDDQEALTGSLHGTGKVILPEPKPLLTETAKFPGLDGRKMSKSYGNTIGLTEEEESVIKKISTMQTDPQRVRRDDSGDPAKCPVWALHEIYSTIEVKDWVVQGCKSASIGCLDCKRQLLDVLTAELKPIRERAEEYENNPQLVKKIITQGAEVARDKARNTLHEVREAMGISYK